MFTGQAVPLKRYSSIGVGHSLRTVARSFDGPIQVPVGVRMGSSPAQVQPLVVGLPRDRQEVAGVEPQPGLVLVGGARMAQDRFGELRARSRVAGARVAPEGDVLDVHRAGPDAAEEEREARERGVGGEAVVSVTAAPRKR